jgi:hypothetical protein
MEIKIRIKIKIKRGSQNLKGTSANRGGFGIDLRGWMG